MPPSFGLPSSIAFIKQQRPIGDGPDCPISIYFKPQEPNRREDLPSFGPHLGLYMTMFHNLSLKAGPHSLLS